MYASIGDRSFGPCKFAEIRFVDLPDILGVDEIGRIHVYAFVQLKHFQASSHMVSKNF